MEELQVLQAQEVLGHRYEAQLGPERGREGSQDAKENTKRNECFNPIREDQGGWNGKVCATTDGHLYPTRLVTCLNLPTQLEIKRERRLAVR